MKLAAATLLALPLLLAADGPPQADCKASLEPWVGKPVAELVKAWGEPTEKSGWKRGGSKLVYSLAERTPTEAQKAPSPDAPDREHLGSAGGPAAPESYSRSYVKGKDGKGEWKEKGMPEPWLPSAYLFYADKDGTIKKADCKKGPAGG